MLVHCQNEEEAKAVLCMLADSVGARLRAQGVYCRNLTDINPVDDHALQSVGMMHGRG